MNPGSADEQLRRLETIADSSLQSLDPSSLTAELLDRVAELLDVDTVVVLLLDRVAEQLVAHAARGLEEEVRQDVRVPVGSGFAGRVAAERRPIVLDHVGPDVVVNPLLWRRGIVTMMGVPLLAAGELVGVMHVGSLRPRAFTEHDVAILQLAAERIATAITLRQTHTERAAARALQRSLLPSALPVLPGLQIATRFVAAAELGVGGDWYDAFVLPDGDVGIVIGDVAGNGLRAAIVMGRLRSVVRAYAVEHASPAEVLDRVHAKFAHFEPDELATVAYARLDRGLHRFTLAMAGHLPPVLAVPGEESVLLELDHDPPICAPLAAHRRDHTIDLPPGSTVAFYTDGLVERRRIALDERLEMLRQTVRSGPAYAVAAEVMDQLVGSHAVEDDTALLVVTRS